MGEQARVSSTEAIEGFRAALLVYISKAKAMLEDAVDEVARTRQWLDSDRLPYWENQLRVRKRLLENAQHALFSAQTANLREATTAEHAAVQKAKRAFMDAEDKLKIVNRWRRHFDNQVQPILKQLEQFRTLLANDLPRAARYLDETVKVLEAYAGIARQGGRPVDEQLQQSLDDQEGHQ